MWTKLEDPVQGIMEFNTQQYQVGTYVIINNDPAKQFTSGIDENRYHCAIRLECLKRGGKILNGSKVTYKGSARLNCFEELIEDGNINIISQKYSDKLARESELEFSGNKYKGEDLGEIIFCCKSETSPKELVDIWYNEGSYNYNYKKEEANIFTQMIWKNSKSLGIGHTLAKDNKIYVVVNFYPEGNVKGQFSKNVFPVKINSENNSSFYSVTTTFLEEALCAHNELREKHNSPPLILNPTLTTLAQNHSELLAKKGNLNYSNNKLENKKLGENLFMSKMKCTGEEVSLYWYKGIKYYDFQNMNNTENEETKNFTQLIWKSTKEVGFGVTTDKKGNFYVVANYFPCGNIKGQYQNNVLSY